MARRRKYEEDSEDDEDFDSEDIEELDESLELEDDDEDLFEFERKERFEARRKAEAAEIESLDSRYPGIKKYGSKARKIIEEYEERISDYERGDIAKVLSTVPEGIGNRLLTKIHEFTGQSEKESEDRDEEEPVSGLEEKVGGLLMLAQTSDIQDEKLFDVITQKIGFKGSEREYHAVVSASSQIAEAKSNPKISQHLDAFLMMTLSDRTEDPKSLFSRLVKTPYLTDLALATRGRISEVPEHIGKLLEDDTERDKYIQTLVEWPASIHLSADRLKVAMTDPEYKTFVRNWVGESASADRVEFFDGLYEKYGYSGLVKLGKPLLKAILSKGKGNKKLQEKLREEGIGTIYAKIPETNQSPPAWIFRLRKRVESAEPERVLEVINDEVGNLGRVDREKELRSKYSVLVAKVKKTTPVARGDFSSTDIVVTLDERLLDAMQFHDGKKTRMLEAMGKNLKRVNKVYKDSGLPAGVIVGLYDSEYNHNQIMEAAGAVSETDKVNLRKLEESGKLGTLFWLARTRVNAEDVRYVASLGSEEQAESFEKVARATEDPRKYFSSLSLEQMLTLKEVEQEVLTEVIETVDPNSLRDYVELTKATKGKINGALRTKKKNINFSKFRGHEEVFNILDGSWAQEDAKTIGGLILEAPSEESALKYCQVLKALTPYARIHDRWKLSEETFKYGPIATALKNSSATELEIYEKIGEVYTKSSSWGSTRERIGFDKLQGIVKKTAELVDSVKGLRERADSFVGHIRNYSSTQESLDDLVKLESIAKATVSATPEESQLLADIGSRHVGFTFTNQNLDKVRQIGELGSKLESLKAMSGLVRSDDQLSTVLDYAIHNPLQILTTAYNSLRQGFSNDDEFYGILAISRDRDLSQKAESIDQGYRPTFLKFAASVSTPDRLKTLPESHFYVAAQAYEFARQHNMDSEFFKGLNGSLQQGTVDQWANAIIKHFRDESKGGGVYRKLGEENETRRYIQAR